MCVDDAVYTKCSKEHFLIPSYPYLLLIIFSPRATEMSQNEIICKQSFRVQEESETNLYEISLCNPSLIGKIWSPLRSINICEPRFVLVFFSFVRVHLCNECVGGWERGFRGRLRLCFLITERESFLNRVRKMWAKNELQLLWLCSTARQRSGVCQDISVLDCFWTLWQGLFSHVSFWLSETSSKNPSRGFYVQI